MSAVGSTVSLAFPLDVEDDWPPVAVECLPFRVTDEGYVALVPPLFVKGLSVDDVIAVTLEAERVESWHHVARSGRTTLWIGRTAETDTIEVALEELRALGCDTVSFEQAGTHAVDVPETVGIGTVDAILETLDGDCVAVAFPSMRHPE